MCIRDRVTHMRTPFAVLAAFFAACITHAQPCTPEWSTQFAETGITARVLATTTFDFDGAGPDPASLVVGGEFTIIGDLTISRIARWDGAEWQPIGSGLSGPVRCFAVFDTDGPGPL